MAVQQKAALRAIIAGLIVAGGVYSAVAFVANDEADRTFYGSVDIRDVSLGFRTDGRVAELLVEEGQSVAADQVLARLDSMPQQRAFNETAAQYKAAVSRLELLSAGYDPYVIAEAQARVNELRVTLANAERSATRSAELYKSGAQSQRAVDDAQAQRDEIKARLNAAEQSLAKLKRGYRHEEIAEARANVERAEAAKARAQLQLEDTELRAQEAGIVQTRVVERGSLMTAGAPAFVIARTDEMWVRAYVPETLLGKATPGATVEIQTDVRDKPYIAHIASVSTQAEFTPKHVETTDLRTSLVYRVKLKIENPDQALRQGMPVTARFTLGNES